MLITNFASGELSKKLAGRVDLQQYFQSAARIENFDIQPTGGAFRRVGFKRICKLYDNCRIIPFIINKNFSFLIVLSPSKCYIYKTDGTKLNCSIKKAQVYKADEYEGSGEARRIVHRKGEAKTGTDGKLLYDTETTQGFISTEYSDISTIQEVQYAQNFNLIIFVHKNYKPWGIRYNIAQNTFTLSELRFDFSPDVALSNPYTADSNKDPFRTGGEYIVKYGRLYKKKDNVYKDVDNDKAQVVTSVQDSTATGYAVSGIFNSDGYYPSCIAFFNSRLWLAGSENEPQRIYASRPVNTHRTEYNDFSTYEKYVNVEKITSNPELRTFTADINQAETNKLVHISQDMTAYISDEDVRKGVWYVCNDAYLPIGSKVTARTKDTITIDKSVDSSLFPKTTTATTDAQGKPTTITETDNLTAKVFTLSKWSDPNVAGSDDYEYTVVSQNVTLADNSFSFEIASEQNDAIKWLSSGDTLLVGTESGIWQIPSETTATNIRATNPSRSGTDDIQALRIDTATVFFSQGKKSIKEYYRGQEEQGFITNNLALHAEQMLFESRAIDFDYVSNPFYKLIVTREDGTIASLLYDKNSGVLGWTRIIHGHHNDKGTNRKGYFVSCATVRGEEENDLIFQVVKDGTTASANYYLEMLDGANKVYLDSWQEVTSATLSTKAAQYDSEAVVIVQKKDGTTETKPKDEATATGGLTLETGDKAYIGYNYTSYIKSMPIIASDPSAKKRIVNLLLRFDNSYFPTMKCAEKEEFFLDEEEPFTGYKYIDYPQNSNRDVAFELEYKEPNECNILCIQANLA